MVTILMVWRVMILSLVGMEMTSFSVDSEIIHYIVDLA